MLALLIAAILALGGEAVSSVAQHDAHSYASGDQEQRPSAKKGEDGETFWKWLTKDAAAFFTFVLALLTAVLAGISLTQIYYLRRADQTAGIAANASRKAADAATEAAQATRDQLTLAYPPKLELSSLHIWNKGNGSPFNRDNAAPSLTPRNVIQGAAFILNSGRETATIVSSDILPEFRSKPLMMNDPGWNNPGGNELRKYANIPPDYPVEDIVKQIKPGASLRWEFEVTVPSDPTNETLYVIGNVAYQDRLGTYYHVQFARPYDPAKGDFGEGYQKTY